MSNGGSDIGWFKDQMCNQNASPSAIDYVPMYSGTAEEHIVYWIPLIDSILLGSGYPVSLQRRYLLIHLPR